MLNKIGNGWIEKNPDKRYFFITYGDTTLYCRCPECLKLDGDTTPVKHGKYGHTHYAKRHLHWINPIARAVAKTLRKTRLWRARASMRGVVSRWYP